MLNSVQREFSGELDSNSILILVHARQYAVMAGRWLMQQRANLTEVQWEQKKHYIDLVTEFDCNNEKQIIKWINDRFPEHLILAEEATADQSIDWSKISQADQYCWVIDPLDGTTNFIHGIPHFAVSISVVKNGLPLVGVVYDPYQNELFTAVRGMGVTLNDRKLLVSEQKDLKNSIIHTGFSARDWYSDNLTRLEIPNMYGRCRNVRIFGSAALDLAYLAAGRLDGFWHWRLAPWDIAAGILFVQEAGGQVTDLEGTPFQFSQDCLVASNGFIHAELLSALKGTAAAPACRQSGV